MLYSLNYQCLEVAKATLSWYINDYSTDPLD